MTLDEAPPGDEHRGQRGDGMPHQQHGAVSSEASLEPAMAVDIGSLSWIQSPICWVARPLVGVRQAWTRRHLWDLNFWDSWTTSEVI